jgi:hypothetical protein
MLYLFFLLPFVSSLIDFVANNLVPFSCFTRDSILPRDFVLPLVEQSCDPGFTILADPNHVYQVEFYRDNDIVPYILPSYENPYPDNYTVELVFVFNNTLPFEAYRLFDDGVTKISYVTFFTTDLYCSPISYFEFNTQTTSHAVDINMLQILTGQDPTLTNIVIHLYAVFTIEGVNVCWSTLNDFVMQCIDAVQNNQGGITNTNYGNASVIDPYIPLYTIYFAGMYSQALSLNDMNTLHQLKPHWNKQPYFITQFENNIIVTRV